MLCLLCNGTDKSYKPEPDKDFICGSCVQLLLRADQDDLKQAYAKAIEKGYINKARAIESFLPNGGNYEQRKPKSKKRRRHSNRTRIDRVARSKKERIKRSEVSTPIAVL
jgi:hypothetical protein